MSIDVFDFSYNMIWKYMIFISDRITHIASASGICNLHLQWKGVSFQLVVGVKRGFYFSHMQVLEPLELCWQTRGGPGTPSSEVPLTCWVRAASSEVEVRSSCWKVWERLMEWGLTAGFSLGCGTLSPQPSGPGSLSWGPDLARESRSVCPGVAVWSPVPSQTGDFALIFPANEICSCDSTKFLKIR